MLILLVAGCTKFTRQQSSQLSEVERGRRVVESMKCNDCHTPDYQKRSSVPEEDWLVGGTIGFRDSTGTVYPANLRLLLNSMSEDEWVKFARQMNQNAPMGSVLLPTASERDLRAIYSFVKYLGPKGAPALPRLPAGATPKTQYIDYPYLH